MSRVQGAAVKRAVGYAPAFDFVAEVAVDCGNGVVVAREGGWSADGAVQRAKLAARDHMVFAGFKRACGYVAAGFRNDFGGVYRQEVGYA